MSPKTVPILAILAVLVLAVPTVAVDGAQSKDYPSQLDDNGKDLYLQLGTMFKDAEKDPVDTLSISYKVPTPSLFKDSASADSYAKAMVKDTLAAYYLSDPSVIWLWDYPVASVEIGVVTGEVRVSGSTSTWYAPTSVTFQLSVPKAFVNDPSTEANETLVAITAVKDALKAFEGDTVTKVRSINSELRGIASMTDSEGTVSNIHDALVTKKSSSAGVAAAFTVLAKNSEVDALTVVGYDSNSNIIYWNQVSMNETWYAVDCTWNGSQEKNCLLVGTFTSVIDGQKTSGFGSTHSVDLNLIGTTLQAPAISQTGYFWPDETPFYMKYGAQILLAAIGAIIAVSFLYAIRSGVI